MIGLAAVVAEVESSGNPYAMRFEPALYAHWQQGPRTAAQNAALDTIEIVNRCSAATAVMIACTSWTEYQLLGENLYSVCALRTPIGTFLGLFGAQAQAFADFVKARTINFTLEEIQADSAKRTKFISEYNGPADIETYWARMQAAIKLLTPSPSS